ncbi:hypothetical protein B0H10DRAFT_1970772 [Mycena sp. CBHHK59/15]|nr:hypothetical protein B0H10DRAFT_1970772 [Mycena sp. CBHHK59/15]
MVRKLQSLENPYDYNLTLLQNPSLPYKCLPTTLNFLAYDKAILCAAVLSDESKKGVMDICEPYKKVLKKVQLLDALANFHYYAREELPGNVKTALREASIYHKMMISCVMDQGERCENQVQVQCRGRHQGCPEGLCISH